MESDSRSLKEQLRHTCDYRSCSRAFVEKGGGQWDSFWVKVVEEKRDECCFVLEFPKREKKRSILHHLLTVPEGVSRSVMLRFDHGINAEISLEIELSSGSQLGIFFGGILGGGSEFSFDIRSVQKQRDTDFLFYGRMVSFASSSCTAVTSGHLAPTAEGCSCVFDTQVLQIGDGGKVYGEPRMEVLRGDAVADHGFSAGRVPEEVRAYMESRGLDRKEAENMYAHGFLEL